MNSVLLPIFLYPVLLWVLFTGITFAEGLAEGARSRVAVHGLPTEHGDVLDSLRSLGSVEVVEAPAGVAESEARLARGELDAVAEFLPPPQASEALPANFTVRIAYDRSLERSRRARQRVERVVERYRERWLRREAEGMAIPPEDIEGFRVAAQNVATGQQLGALLLSQMLPLFLVIMVALGCFVPAIGHDGRRTGEVHVGDHPHRGCLPFLGGRGQVPLCGNPGRDGGCAQCGRHVPVDGRRHAGRSCLEPASSSSSRCRCWRFR